MLHFYWLFETEANRSCQKAINNIKLVRSSKIAPFYCRNIIFIHCNLSSPGSAGQQLFVYIQTIQSYLAPPITMVFGLGILWTGLTAAGALSGLVIGFIMGMAKFIAGNVWTVPSCGSVDDRPGFAKMHFMFYGEIILFQLLNIAVGYKN